MSHIIIPKSKSEIISTAGPGKKNNQKQQKEQLLFFWLFFFCWSRFYSSRGMYVSPKIKAVFVSVGSTSYIHFFSHILVHFFEKNSKMDRKTCWLFFFGMVVLFPGA